jgi:hypothetical protein
MSFSGAMLEQEGLLCCLPLACNSNHHPKVKEKVQLRCGKTSVVHCHAEVKDRNPVVLLVYQTDRSAVKINRGAEASFMNRGRHYVSNGTISRIVPFSRLAAMSWLTRGSFPIQQLEL